MSNSLTISGLTATMTTQDFSICNLYKVRETLHDVLGQRDTWAANFKRLSSCVL